MTTKHRAPTWIRVAGLALVGLAPTIACGPPKAADGEDSTTETGTGDPEPTTTTTTTSPETSGEESEGEVTSVTSTPFLPETDYAEQACDPWQQDCPEGEKCVPYATVDVWDSNKCVPITGAQGIGEPCVYGGAIEATDDCAAGSMCWDFEEVDGQLVGECVALCSGDPEDPSCPEGSHCLISGSGVLTLCISVCDPLLQDCPGGEGCYWFGADFSCAPPVDGVGAAVGEPCDYYSDCTPGALCAPAEALPSCADAACCTPYCELPNGDCAGLPGTTCVAFFEEGTAPPAYMDLGVCALL